ncbi:MAG: hypothetical protein GTN69_01265 [Armatimonadetes bacterium]|nr:hypothetical protein [Armatimonadota bacterium]NIM24589.1 hypothetical protein [Armatimonadota bacterium]NIM76851.1 hypothetical protein [Armatimonadota bacterium]NIN06662.1 hypothetical protein [Armatimonadota bacterium]NIO74534.1 hypothetical protein [Armatimonadota bacterium]
MSVKAGFDGFYKDSEWVPVTVDISNRGPEVRGALTIVVPNHPDFTATTYLHPVVLGSQTDQRIILYIRGRGLLGRLTVELRSEQGPDAEAETSITSLSPEDSLIVVLARERGALSFLTRSQQGTASTQGGTRPSISGQSGYSAQGGVRVVDSDPPFLPDRAQGYGAVELVVIGGITAQAFPAEVKQALRGWVKGGGTLVVMGGPDWARLTEPFYSEMLPVEVSGAIEVKGLDGLGAVYGSPPDGTIVISRATPKPGALVRVRQGALPLIAEAPFGSGRVIFLAFDATRPPVRGWTGQAMLWEDLLSRAKTNTPLLQAALTQEDGSYMYGPPYGRGNTLSTAVVNIPAMKTPPFWWVALFLGGYVILLVPVNYVVLKRLGRRELAWLTTPVIVVFFMLIAYFIGYGMRGGRLLINQVSLIETQAGARSAGITTFAGLFSPAKTAYGLGTDDVNAIISEVPPTEYGQKQRDLTVLETETVFLPRVAMNMWSMRIFRIESLAELGEGLNADLTLTNGRVTGQVTNRTGLRLTDCEISLGGTALALGDLADGASAKVDHNIGEGQPASVSLGRMSWSPYGRHYMHGGRGGARASAAEQMRATVDASLFGYDRARMNSGGPLLKGWYEKRFHELTVDGGSANPTQLGLAIFHLPLSVSRNAPVSIPYGVSTSAVIDHQGIEPWSLEEGEATIADGYIIKEFRLPIDEESLEIDELEVFTDFSPAGGASGQLSLHVYNWQTAAWDALPDDQGAVNVPNPAAYLRLPEGLVRVKFVNESSGSRSGYGYGEVTLSQMDVSLRGHFK